MPKTDVQPIPDIIGTIERASWRKQHSRNKYRAKPTVIDGFRFDSKRESERYAELKLLERAGEIFGLVVHPKFSIDIQGEHVCTVELDFAYTAGNVTKHDVVEDVKGVDTAMSRLKRKLVHACHGVEVAIVK